MKKALKLALCLAMAVFTACAPALLAYSAPRFSDVGASDWHMAYINYTVDLGLLDKRADGLFEPESLVTRGEMMTVLSRLYTLMTGKELAFRGGAAFSDADSAHEHADAVFWGFEAGIAKGYPDGSFKPDAFISREGFAAILVRFSDYIGEEITQSAESMCTENAPHEDIKRENYEDKASVSPWALKEVEYLSFYGIMNGFKRYDPRQGKTVRDFLPHAYMTRGETAAAITRFYQAVMFKEDTESAREVISFNYAGAPNSYGNMEPHLFLPDKQWTVLSDYESYEALLSQTGDLLKGNSGGEYTSLHTSLTAEYFQTGSLLAVELQSPNSPVYEVRLTDCAISGNDVAVSFFCDSHGYTADVSGYIFFIHVPKTVTNAQVQFNYCVHQQQWPFI